MLKLGRPATFVRTLFVNFVKPPLLPSVTKLKPNFLIEPVRHTGFFNRLTGEQLWKGVTSVSNAGRRKGRGRKGNVRQARDLNFGQRIGEGKIKIVLPGLNTPVIKEQQVQDVGLDKDNKASAAPPPPPPRRSRSVRLNPLERGWSGRKKAGRKLGPPEPVQDETFEGFESIILRHKMVSRLTSVLGRRMLYYSIVATGNGKGLIGLGRSRRLESRSGLLLARKKASKRLISIDMLDGTTVNHDFFSEYGRTRIFVFKKPEGYGLRCHRVIKALCELIGIKNLHARVEGPTNVIHMIRAFIVGLLRQKSYQQIADETKLHLVEFRSDRNWFPQVLASPEKCLTPQESLENPVLFEEYIMGGKLHQVPPKRLPFYMKLPSWTTHLKRTQYHRNHNKVKIELMAEYGCYKSHLTKVYPECRNNNYRRYKENETNNANESTG